MPVLRPDGAEGEGVGRAPCFELGGDGGRERSDLHLGLRRAQGRARVFAPDDRGGAGAAGHAGGGVPGRRQALVLALVGAAVPHALLAALHRGHVEGRRPGSRGRQGPRGALLRRLRAQVVHEQPRPPQPGDVGHRGLRRPPPPHRLHHARVVRGPLRRDAQLGAPAARRPRARPRPPPQGAAVRRAGQRLGGRRGGLGRRGAPRGRVPRAALQRPPRRARQQGGGGAAPLGAAREPQVRW